MKTSKLTGAALDWAVEVANGNVNEQGRVPRLAMCCASTDWAQGGPIKQREKIVDGIVPQAAGSPIEWFALKHSDAEHCRDGARSYGPTPLIAAMRCFVASKLGADVEVPDELDAV